MRTAFLALALVSVTTVAHAQFMPEDARVLDERHLAQIAADVRAADAHRVDLHQRFVRAGGCGFGLFDEGKLAGSIERERFHFGNLKARVPAAINR